MALYFFRINDGNHSAITGPDDIGDVPAAWTEMIAVCSDLVSSASRDLKQNDEWQIELLDLLKKPMFRIRLIAETFN
jgi:hypothetical protein